MNMRVILAVALYFTIGFVHLHLASVSSAQVSQPAITAQFSAPQYWCRDWATGPRIPLLADADGDGHADCVALYHDGEMIVDMARTSPRGKIMENRQARRDFGRDGLAATAARFTGGIGADVLAIFPDGSVRLASGMKPGEATFPTAQTVAQIPHGQMPTSPRLLSADFTGDGKPDALLVGSDGRLLLLENTARDRFTPHLVTGLLPDSIKEVAAGSVGDGNAAARLFWITPDHQLMRAAIRVGNGGEYSLSPAFPVTKAEPGAKLAIGHFRGESGADVLVGRTLLPGGDPGQAYTMAALPSVAEMQGDDCWLVGDIDGNGCDDLLRRRSTADRFKGQDVLIHYSSRPGDTRKGYVSTAQDGLLDAWKTGAVDAGGLDLTAMGCRVGHKDVIVEIGSFENVDQNFLKQEMQKDVDVFAALPVVNPDGTRGIALHVLIQTPVPLSRHDELYHDFDQHYPSPDHRGITHYYFADKKGPLVSMLPGDNGHFDGNYNQFLHEFGHNLTLVHEGFHDGPAFCPLYPSVMNYTYNGSLFSVDSVHYSDGRFAGVTLDERHLSEVLPFSIDQVAFLAHSPYYFPLRPGATPDETLVDWNRNGIFGEKDVAADINYRPGSNLQRSEHIGKAQSAPTLVTHRIRGGEQELWLLAGQGKQALDRAHPGALVLREWRGKDSDTERSKWSAPQLVEAEGVTGEASAWDGADGTTWIAYPTTTGVCVRALISTDSGSVSGSGGTTQVMPAIVARSTAQAQPKLASFGGKWWLLLWRGAGIRVTACKLQLSTEISGLTGATVGPEVALPLYSAGPLGATVDTHGLLLSGIECRDATKRGWMTQYHYAPAVDGTLTATEHVWCGGRRGRGYASRRSVALWEPCDGLPSGRAYLIAGRSGGSPNEADPDYVAMTIAQDDDFGEDQSGGFLTRRLHGGAVPSAYAPGACVFGPDIVLAQTLQNEDVLVTWGGRGIEAGIMGDFNDVQELSEVGLRRSIYCVKF